MAVNVEAIVKYLMDGGSITALGAGPLEDDAAAAIVDRLKLEADSHWGKDPRQSLTCADQIISIGRARNDLRQVGLGTMARGDALRFSGQLEAAWTTLEEAGMIFKTAGDEVGWARTRIGRLLIGANLNCVPDALADAELARAIFERHGEREKLLRLLLNTAIVYSDSLSNYRYALTLYQAAHEIALSLGLAGRHYLAMINHNMGYAYNYLGQFEQALAAYCSAKEIFIEEDDIYSLDLIELNTAYIAQIQGQFRRALQLLHQARKTLTERWPLEAALADRDQVECYLALNRYSEARELALQVITEFRRLDATHEMARALILLATAEAEVGNWDAARAALVDAEPIFAKLGASSWIATIQLRRSRIALRQNDLETARQAARAASVSFDGDSQQALFAESMLLEGQVSFAYGDLEAASASANRALKIARRCMIPTIQYSSHLLLGNIAEQAHQPVRALRQYGAAVATIERIQKGLTITLRPSFLENKNEALRAVIRLSLQSDQPVRAFESLERAKSQALMGYLADRESLRWRSDDPQTQTLLSELNTLRRQHQSLYYLAHPVLTDEKDRKSGVDPQQALRDLVGVERRMRAISEQLYLRSGDSEMTDAVAVPRLQDVQGMLDPASLLIEFYNDGAQVWAFTLDSEGLNVNPLPITVAALDRLIGQFQFNVACALQAGQVGPAVAGLNQLAKRILGQLYTALIAPLSARIAGKERLVVVPYGALHYLPFHLLFNAGQYLIETYELIILPAASLITHHGPQRSGGALAIAHSWDGALPQTVPEAARIHSLFGGELFSDGAATRQVLDSPPRQILHIAAHGQYRIDQPDLSYIQLNDGQLYTDDLLQNDLSYELVTLSACETGRANVAAGDELIGLGRGFLYAGAGALVTSLWRVDDALTIALMEDFYQALRSGASKPAALREAQRAVLRGQPQLHPAFWGAFQFVGDPRPLSIHMA
jgi:tetratricopeptide (TPR) repeat protein